MRDYILFDIEENTILVRSDTEEHAYISLLSYLANYDYTIHGLKRTACGNRHDANWQEEYTVVAGGGPFSDFFGYLTGRMSDSCFDFPMFKNVESLTQDQIQNWAKQFAYYDGEEKHRYIFASNNKEAKVLKVYSLFAEPIEKVTFFPIARQYPELASFVFLKVAGIDSKNFTRKSTFEIAVRAVR